MADAQCTAYNAAKNCRDVQIPRNDFEYVREDFTFQMKIPSMLNTSVHKVDLKRNYEAIKS